MNSSNVLNFIMIIGIITFIYTLVYTFKYDYGIFLLLGLLLIAYLYIHIYINQYINTATQKIEIVLNKIDEVESSLLNLLKTPFESYNRIINKS